MITMARLVLGAAATTNPEHLQRPTYLDAASDRGTGAVTPATNPVGLGTAARPRSNLT
jgi:hypothetical protein